jgi:hypothetical protein
MQDIYFVTIENLNSVNQQNNKNSLPLKVQKDVFNLNDMNIINNEITIDHIEENYNKSEKMKEPDILSFFK